MFTIRLITSDQQEHNYLCEQYHKIPGEHSIECFGVKGIDPDYIEFSIDGDPYTEAYVMNPDGNTIDKMLCQIDARDFQGPDYGTACPTKIDDPSLRPSNTPING